MMGEVIPFPSPPAGGLILIDRARGGGFVVMAYNCPRAPGWRRTFTHAGDAADAAEALAGRTGAEWDWACDPDTADA